MLNFPNLFISITNLLENESTNMGGWCCYRSWSMSSWAMEIFMIIY
jgi:hypothetical protein